MSNMFKGDEAAEDPTFFADLKEDVEEECRNCGEVVKVCVDMKSTNGNIWVEFAEIQGASKC